jgi:hypothetical protein
LLRYIVPKGYIAVDGTSLTVVDVLDDAFTFMLVAYTQQHITLPRKSIGSRVNLEVDMLSNMSRSSCSRGTMAIASIETVLADLRAGRFVIIVDDEDRGERRRPGDCRRIRDPRRRSTSWHARDVG